MKQINKYKAVVRLLDNTIREFRSMSFEQLMININSLYQESDIMYTNFFSRKTNLRGWNSIPYIVYGSFFKLEE